MRLPSQKNLALTAWQIFRLYSLEQLEGAVKVDHNEIKQF